MPDVKNVPRVQPDGRPFLSTADLGCSIAANSKITTKEFLYPDYYLNPEIKNIFI